MLSTTKVQYSHTNSWLHFWDKLLIYRSLALLNSYTLMSSFLRSYWTVRIRLPMLDDIVGYIDIIITVSCALTNQVSWVQQEHINLCHPTRTLQNSVGSNEIIASGLKRNSARREKKCYNVKLYILKQQQQRGRAYWVRIDGYPLGCGYQMRKPGQTHAR